MSIVSPFFIQPSCSECIENSQFDSDDLISSDYNDEKKLILRKLNDLERFNDDLLNDFKGIEDQIEAFNSEEKNGWTVVDSEELKRRFEDTYGSVSFDKNNDDVSVVSLNRIDDGFHCSILHMIDSRFMKGRDLENFRKCIQLDYDQQSNVVSRSDMDKMIDNSVNKMISSLDRIERLQSNWNNTVNKIGMLINRVNEIADLNNKK